jgi:hypothetical protein
MRQREALRSLGGGMGDAIGEPLTQSDFDTIPSNPSLQPCRNTTAPSIRYDDTPSSALAATGVPQ